jgi:hypothetical protein
VTGRVWTASSHGVDWQVELDRDRLLPGRLTAGRVTLTSRDGVEARGLSVILRGEEHWRYETSSTDAQGHSHTETRTGTAALPNVPIQVTGPLRLGRGETRSFDVEIPVPAMGPASLDAEVAGVEWELEVKLDIDGGLDSAIDVPIVILQPTALLRAGVVRVGEFDLYEAVDSAADEAAGTIELDPVPLVCGEPFTARLHLRLRDPIDIQEVRVELRVRVEATVSGGLDETINVWVGRARGPGQIAGEVTFEVGGILPDRPLPTIDLPHGRTDAEFHVIFARAMARDPHLVRGVAIATTREV